MRRGSKCFVLAMQNDGNGGGGADGKSFYPSNWRSMNPAYRRKWTFVGESSMSALGQYRTSPTSLDRLVAANNFLGQSIVSQP